MLLYTSLALFLSLSGLAHSASPKQQQHKTRPTGTLAAAAASSTSPVASPPPEPCTVRSPHSGAFFDLKPLHITAPGAAPEKSPSRLSTHGRALVRDYSWNATGWDIGYNFTMNFCGGVVEDLDRLGGVAGVDRDMYRNVSAYYRKNGQVYSIGQENQTPVIRGRKMVLNYTNGSPCDSPHGRRSADDGAREIIGGDDDDKPKTPAIRRKSTIISMLCEKDPLMPQLTLSFLAASQDECTYFFEARSSAACAGIEQAKQTLSPSGVFGVIVLIAVMVYVVGGCVYSRVVLQQRGWRQLPNYGLWAGIFGFFRDLAIILFSSCTRCLPFARRSRSASASVSGGLHGDPYSRMSGGGINGAVNGGVDGGVGRNSGGPRRDTDAENRLIDELNEEWED